MTYYHLPTDNERQPRRSGEHKTSDGFLLTPPEGGWTEELAALCGFVPVVDTPRPDDTATTTHDRSVELVNGTPTVVWTQRDKTPDDLAGEQQQANRSTIEDQARNAFAGNRTYAASTPTAAQTTAQVKALSRQMNGVLRLLLNELDGTN